MKVFNLRCAAEHAFEGWFRSEDDYDHQVNGGMLECPLCGSHEIQRSPSAPYVNVAVTPVTAKPKVPEARPDAVVLQRHFVQMARQIMASTEDVGDRFAEEARRIHYKEVPERSIRGVATREEAAALEDEGIAVVPLPFADALKETLQ
ncbi:MAG TPA: DUF1178 family protein [Burkholderiaceae bacterium]|nr:DUF1178 family protein [Burkholderiaceae bacterium]